MPAPKSPHTGISLGVLEHMRAGFSGFWLKSVDHPYTLEALDRMLSQERWAGIFWSCVKDPGTTFSTEAFFDYADAFYEKQPSDQRLKIRELWAKFAERPNSLLSLAKILQQRLAEFYALALEDADDRRRVMERFRLLVVMDNYDHADYLPRTCANQQLMSDVLYAGSANRYAVAVLSHGQSSIPTMLERQFVLLDQDLPGSKSIRESAEKASIAEEQPKDSEGWSKLTEAAAGLTTLEIENACALSIVRHGKLESEEIWSIKAQTLKKQGILELYQGSDSFEQMGGMDNFKSFTTKLLTCRSDNPLAKPRGLLLLGVAGAGKSAAVKCAGNATGRRVLMLNLGDIRSKWQGESDANLKRVLATADAMAPNILFLDEVEKGLAGLESSGETEGGTGSRLFGTLLTWMNDHTSDVVVMATANDVRSLPAPFARAERFDAMFFFDVPEPAERRAIWAIYIKLFNHRKVSEAQLDKLVDRTAGWTGAEIRAACRQAALLDITLNEAADNITPVSERDSQQLEELRSWATGVCLSTSYYGKYSKSKSQSLVKAAAPTSEDGGKSAKRVIIRNRK